MFFRAVGAVQVETHAGIVTHQFQPVAIDGDEVVLTCRKLVVRLVAVGRARLDAEADVSGTGPSACWRQISCLPTRPTCRLSRRNCGGR